MKIKVLNQELQSEQGTVQMKSGDRLCIEYTDEDGLRAIISVTGRDFCLAVHCNQSGADMFVQTSKHGTVFIEGAK